MNESEINRIPNIVITSLFVIMISTFAWASVLKLEDAFQSENRELAAMPEIKWGRSIFSLPVQFENFISDQFPLRYHMIRLSHRARYYVFEENFVSTTIIGEDGWLFQNNQKSMDICQNAVNWGALGKYTKAINGTNEFLNSKGIEFAVAIIPEKCHVYTDEAQQFLPDLNMPASTLPLIDHLTSTSNAPVINLFEVLNSQKDRGQLYFKNDTHWNTLGAYLGYQGLISGLMPGISPQEMAVWDYLEDVDSQERMGDIGMATGLPEFIHETANPPNYVMIKPVRGQKDKYIYENPDADNNLTLVVFHDSFFGIPPIREYLATHFSRTIYLNYNWGYRWTNDPEKLEAVIEEWDPDIILVAYIERNIKLLLKD